MKRGAMSIEMIIIIILALLVLVIVAMSFTGGMRELMDRITGVYKIYASEDLSMARDRCASECSLRPENFCALEIPIRNKETGKDDSFKCTDSRISAKCPAA